MSTTDQEIVQDIVSRIKSALPGGATLHTPVFAGNESKYLQECIDSTFVSSVGKYVDQVEQKLAEITGATRAIAVASGTAALHTCLHVAGVKHNEEVLIPSLTFVATANAVLHAGGVPHFVEAEAGTYGVDAVKLRHYLSEIGEVKNGKCINKVSGRTLAAIVPVHIFGFPADMDALSQIAEEFSLQMIEDAAEAMGSYDRKKHTGSHSRLAALSFNGNKIVTAGGGGAILTSDSALADRIKHVTTTAKIPHPYEYIHDEQGFNYRMPNINAALLLAQLEQLDHFLKQKRSLHQAYTELFSDCEHATILQEAEETSSNYWLIALSLADHATHLQREILQQLLEHKIQVRPPWKCLHELNFLSTYPRMDLSVSKMLQCRTISLPSSAHQYPLSA